MPFLSLPFVQKEPSGGSLQIGTACTLVPPFWGLGLNHSSVNNATLVFLSRYFDTKRATSKLRAMLLWRERFEYAVGMPAVDPVNQSSKQWALRQQPFGCGLPALRRVE